VWPSLRNCRVASRELRGLRMAFSQSVYSFWSRIKFRILLNKAHKLIWEKCTPHLQNGKYLVQMIMKVVSHKSAQDAIPSRLIEAEFQVLGTQIQIGLHRCKAENEVSFRKVCIFNSWSTVNRNNMIIPNFLVSFVCVLLPNNSWTHWQCGTAQGIGAGRYYSTIHEWSEAHEESKKTNTTIKKYIFTVIPSRKTWYLFWL